MTFNHITQDIAVQCVSFNTHSMLLEVGATECISATVCPSNATDKRLIWASSNEDVVDIEGGEIIAKHYGSATVTANTYEGGLSCSFEVICSKTYAQRDYDIMTTEDRALMSCLQLLCEHYESIGDAKSEERKNEIIRRMNATRNKSEYAGEYTYCINPIYPSANLKTTILSVEGCKTLTKQDIIDLHNRDTIILALASLVPPAGPFLAALATAVKNIEQTGDLQLLDLATEHVVAKFWEDLFGNDLIFSLGNTIIELVSTDGKETYVENGFKIAEDDTIVQIRIDYDLGCENIVFSFVVRNDFPVAVNQYGPQRLDGPTMQNQVAAMKKEWLEKGYIPDED